MIRQKINLKNWDWKVMVYYVVTAPNADEILRSLENIGCKGEDLQRAEKSLRYGGLDTGMCYTNHSLGESVVVIARTSSGKEFTASLSHEFGHLANHIGLFYGLDLNGEEVRYISDELIEKSWSISRELVCDECRSIEKDHYGREGGHYE